jgi:hypothetical protein
MRLEVLIVVKMVMVVVWVVMPCGLVDGYQCFGGKYCLHLHPHLQFHTASQYRRLPWTKVILYFLIFRLLDRTPRHL